MINYIQNLGNEVSNIMNTQLQGLSNKLHEIVNNRNELQNSIARSNAAENGYNRPAWGQMKKIIVSKNEDGIKLTKYL